VLSLANAGMTKPILLTNGDVKFLDSEGPRLPIGIVENVKYKEALYELKSGDLLILTTDGITEAQNSKRILFGENRLKEHLLKLNKNNCTAAEIKNSIIQEVKKFTKSEKQSDDLTIVAIRIK
jgi:sigma-B regulation protein RsbU (phosphoserine phosphatase)